jgi:hypothetical protein
MKQDTYQYYLDTYNEYGEVVDQLSVLPLLDYLQQIKWELLFETNDRVK